MNTIQPNLLKVFLFSLLAIFFVACDDDDDEEPMPGNITLSASNTSLSAIRGNSVDASLSLNAEDGVQSLTVSVDGAAAESLSVTAGSTTQQVTYSYTVPADALLNTEYSLDFILTDASSQTASVSVKVIAAPAITATPATYEFERNGETTVSYSGQTDRLNQLAEIKSLILGEADAGNAITEQALLDAYNNVNDNGGGLFSFSSDRQLANKTFQPDVDDRLFLDMFASVASASVEAAGGATASNGQAGLITREINGNTILVDAHGREFTQLIEKGLMGGVFFHQIFNVYLTDARVGADVENVELREGKNYTDMEHHWDEAYGYFGSPVDFTSPWNKDTDGALRFWANYANVVDASYPGINSTLMEAFIAGRAAIVNNDRDGIDAARATLYTHLELVTAGTAIHYINSSLAALNAGNVGELFHVLSEAWAFTNAIRYQPTRRLDLTSIEEIMETDFGAAGNFWNVTAEGLNKAKATLVSTYTEFESIKNDL